MTRTRFSLFALTVFSVVIALTGSVRAEMIYGITANTPIDNGAHNIINLVRFDSATPSAMITIAPITGVTQGHTLRSIDFRPLTGQLYGISNSNTNVAAAQLYIINITTGVCTPKGAGFTLTGPLGPNDKPQIEMEFNPVADRIRVLTAGNINAAGSPFNVNNNFVVHPDTGALLATDGVLRYANPPDPNTGASDISMVAAAYTRNIGGQTTLYGWDQADDTLATIGSVNGTPDTPGSGIMHTVNTPASVFTLANSAVGMDISPDTGILYVTLLKNATFPDTPTDGLYTRDLTTGAITPSPASPAGANNYPAQTYVLDISVIRTTTAAAVTIDGKLTISEGGRGGLVGATVLLTDASGNRQSAVSTKGGRFVFDTVQSGKVYTLSVKSRTYSFDSQIIEVNDSMSGIILNGTPTPR